MKQMLPGGMTLMMSVGEGKGWTALSMYLLSPERSTTKRRSMRLAFATKKAGEHQLVGSVTGSMMSSEIKSRIIVSALSTQWMGIFLAIVVNVGLMGMSFRKVTDIGGPFILLCPSFVTIVSGKEDVRKFFRVGAVVSVEVVIEATVWMRLVGSLRAPTGCQADVGCCLDGKLGLITPRDIKSLRPTSILLFMLGDTMTFVWIVFPSNLRVMVPAPMAVMWELFAAFILTSMGSSLTPISLAISAPIRVVRHPVSGHVRTR